MPSNKRRRWLPEGVTEYRDRHGQPRYRFRKSGHPAHHFSAAAKPGTPEFMEELAAARAAAPVDRRIKPRARSGTIHALCEHYYASPRFLDLSAAAQSAYRRPLEKFREAHGGKPVALIHAAHIDAILGKMKDRPGAANNLRKALGRIFAYAVKLRWRADNPVPLSDSFRKGPGFHCWTEEEIGQFCAHWPRGTKPRLVLELALNTAARRCNIVEIGRRHMIGGRFIIAHAKGGKTTSVPILPECQAAIDAMAVIGMETLIVTEYGKPFSVAGLGKWFKEKCRAAGLENCTLHGLRKAMSRRMAEGGSNALQSRAITGQTQDATFAYYAQSANDKIMADAAVANLTPTPLANRE